MPFYIFNLDQETREDEVVLIKSIKENYQLPVTNVQVELMHPEKVPDTYSARIVFSARLSWFQEILFRWGIFIYLIIAFFGSFCAVFASLGYLFVRQSRGPISSAEKSESSNIEESEELVFFHGRRDSIEQYEEASDSEQLVPLI